MPPNVLLVVLDAARRDALEPYGAPAGSSPAIAQLAGRGHALERVFATACWTIPSHMSMFAGLLPAAAGVGVGSRVTRPTAAAAVGEHAGRFLPEVMRRRGYRTAAISANGWLSDRSGFSTGFEDFISVRSGRRGKIRGEALRARAEWALEAVRANVDDGAREAEGRFREWLGRWRGEPFFWFMNLVECHSPYLPPRPYNDLGVLDSLRAATEARRHLTLAEIWRTCAGAAGIPAGALERMRHLYRCSIRYLDDCLARILEALDERGALEDTLVVVASDHGENLGEGGLIAHALSLDNRILSVPLVWAGPGARAEPDVVSLAALPRLLARAVDLPDHPWAAAELPEGAALAELHAPLSAEDPRTEDALAALALDERGRRLLTTDAVCATDGRLKLVDREGQRWLYDLVSDPLESNPTPLDGSPPEVDVTRLEAALSHPALTPAARAPSPVESEEPSAEEVAQIEEQMRLLGYM